MGRVRRYNDEEIKFVRPKWYSYAPDDPYHTCGRHDTYCELHYICDQVNNDLLHLLDNNTNEIRKKRKRYSHQPEKMRIPKPQRLKPFRLSRRRMIEYDRDWVNDWGMAVHEGNKFHIPSLLSSPARDYLINNKGDKVRIKDHFSGKHVLLYVSNLNDCNPFHSTDQHFLEDSKEIYQEYNPRGQFEVVFVALGNNERVFNQAFSAMPWLAIPHEDQEGRDLIEWTFAIEYSLSVRSVLFDSDGTVLLDNCRITFRYFGPEGFPFTRKKIVEIEYADNALQQELLCKKKYPLKKLLGEFVLSNQGKQVCTTELEDHTVALYIFNLSHLKDHLADELLDTWESLKHDPNKKFAIISVNDPDTCLSYIKDVCGEKYRNLPWYRLSYDARRLCRVLRVPLDYDTENAGHFIIIEPDRYQPLNYFALDVLQKYGIGAYPFTLEKAVEIETTKKRQKMKLCKLLSPSAPLRIGCSTGSKECTVSELSGKHILLLFATNSCYRAGSFTRALKGMYVEKKGTKDEFEIIYISLDCIESQTSFRRSITKMPWLVHSFVPHFAANLAEKLFSFTPRLPAIAAFGSDGNLKAIESNLLFKETWSCEFPFIRSDMDDHVCKEVIRKYQWDLKQVFPEYYSSDED